MSIDLSYKIHHVFTIKTVAIPLLHGDVDVTWVMNKMKCGHFKPSDLVNTDVKNVTHCLVPVNESLVASPCNQFFFVSLVAVEFLQSS